MNEVDFYRVPLTSAEVLATLAALRALDALIAAGAVATDIAPGILASAADRIAAEVPEFVADQTRTLSAALEQALLATREADEAEPENAARDDPPFATRRTRRLLEDAFERDVPVEIEYFVQSRREWTSRRLAISDVYERERTWYVSGQCELRGDFRQFRLDHIRSVHALDEPREEHDPFSDE